METRAEDAGGRLWLAGDVYGVAGLAAGRDYSSRLTRQDGFLPSDRVRVLTLDDQGVDGGGGVWLGFADAPPVFLAPNAEHTRFEGRRAENLGSLDVRDIAVDESTVWLATATGLARIDETATPLEVIREDVVAPDSSVFVDLEALLIDRQGRLWVGGNGVGGNGVGGNGASGAGALETQAV